MLYHTWAALLQLQVSRFFSFFLKSFNVSYASNLLVFEQSMDLVPLFCPNCNGYMVNFAFVFF